ncbi:MAG: restriction endonuclease subunit S [Candidatus Marinimicrobia bacterium]|jgi:type I restriction enzyme, S subunit|nr:restriction endonuclease subunit S [Candidatus Neomarinimicrobiota bacterium]MBT4683470.1 restriction endonuclease subunit S [Chloroflexota bacterium]MBT4994547.1 restriction endonuclease subunit S [Candidatus Neomarinimicrobiota bacterium]MBT5315036.1 restriction endonuclease subunit S [Candidatus Neomarinimicrobiota bacterium]MBT7200706.1 restriction endonuclease subunit S [Candidatus Neomarinimicrobiota bacterium]
MSEYFNSDTLSNCLKKIIDYRGKTPKKLGGDWSNSGYRAISANNVKFEGLAKLVDIRYLDEALYLKWMKDEIHRGDILLTSEAPAGQAMVWDSDEKIVLSQRLYGLRVKDHINNRYLKYYLQSQTGQSEIFKNNSGSTVFGISAITFDNITIRYPDIIAQEKISSALHALDAKIEHNNRANTELESMAKTLYDYWFMQFDFPGESGHPYKSSGGRMVWNEGLNREIPEGWYDSNILAVADLLGGGTPNKNKSEYWQGDIPFFTPTEANSEIFKLTTEQHITDVGLKNCNSPLFEIGTIFITARGSVGKLMINARKMAMNQSCYALSGKGSTGQAFLYFKTKELIHHLQVKSSGSVFNSIVGNDIKFTSLAIPSEVVIEKYSQIAEPIFDQILSNTKQNAELSGLRDWLLPMLMNGQVRVN